MEPRSVSCAASEYPRRPSSAHIAKSPRSRLHACATGAPGQRPLTRHRPLSPPLAHIKSFPLARDGNRLTHRRAGFRPPWVDRTLPARSRHPRIATSISSPGRDSGSLRAPPETPTTRRLARSRGGALGEWRNSPGASREGSLIGRARGTCFPSASSRPPNPRTDGTILRPHRSRGASPRDNLVRPHLIGVRVENPHLRPSRPAGTCRAEREGDRLPSTSLHYRDGQCW